MVTAVVKLATLLLIAQLEAYDIKYYCENLLCDGEINIVCGRSYVSCDITPSNCGDYAQSAPLTECEKQAVLEFHNEIRQTFSSGEDKRFKNTIGNMNVLSYNQELEFSAQCFTNGCKFIQAKCSSTPHFLNVRQNMYFSHFGRKGIQELEIIVNSWNADKSFDINKQSNLSNIIWADATHMGCGRTIFGNIIFYSCIYGSNYKDINEELVKTGEPCSLCTSNQMCSTKYNSLCGEELPDINKFDMPFSIPNFYSKATNLKLHFLFYVLICTFIIF